MAINGILYSIFISLLLRMSILTAVILGIKAAFRYKLSASMHSAIWLILAVQCAFCLFNIQIRADTSIYNYLSPIADGAADTAGAVGAAVISGGFNAKNLIALVWFSGCVILLAWYMSVYIRHRVELRRMRLVEDTAALKILADLKAELGITQIITLRYGTIAETTGKTVVIPENFSPDELKQIMLHELCHFKNKDCVKLWISIIIVCLNWFNPLIWYAFRIFRTDIEMLCDDRVIKRTDSKKCYATALVHSSMAKSKFIPGTTSLHNGKYEVTRRVKRLVAWKKKKPVWAIIAVFVCAGISCMCLTDAVTKAVENKTDIAKTPDPITAVSDVIPVPAATTAPEPNRADNYPDTDADTAAPDTEKSDGPDTETRPALDTDNDNTRDYSGDSRDYDYSYNEPEYSEPEVNTGEDRSDVYDAMGAPDEAAANGSKDTYTLDDGSTVIVHYDDDGTVERGYILDAQEDSGDSDTEQSDIADDTADIDDAAATDGGEAVGGSDEAAQPDDTADADTAESAE